MRVDAQTLREINFNSIKVQLELGVHYFLQVAKSFQFHKGTIRTWGLRSSRGSHKDNFNSIKVQLEPVNP